MKEPGRKHGFSDASFSKWRSRFGGRDVTDSRRLRELEGEIQIASFHPQYQFAGAKANDIGNSTNRSPYPTLHLLREASITRAIDAFGDTRSISADNLARQRLLGPEGLAAVARQTHAV